MKKTDNKDNKDKYKPIGNAFPINNPFRSSRTVQKALKIINKKVVKKD
ncbi:hypothetical protein AGMMS5026_10600 [Endomicrobiia bacterium]|nr:hypothetical protein AGMMS49523_10960 [Endomicrobiia bacterium]GHT14620.1 hypothetical protein AGMMS49571_10620 [Endomicrobiia bacterium]GHT21399.1 hypothetical protein AGMMS49929_09860 [Endomicrobiia bacterium]GHT21936.1 hypothetical protein AGMMS49929_10860 [Endomicrobiia bacterium]GHT29093.1 hypothetical protein AGMMS49995_11000 [Endomicrobiia bacterium]